MLNDIILSELFDKRFRVPDIVIKHVNEELIALGCIVQNVENNHDAVIIHLLRDDITYTLRIDKLAQIFMINNNTKIVCGDWDMIINALE